MADSGLGPHGCQAAPSSGFHIPAGMSAVAEMGHSVWASGLSHHARLGWRGPAACPSHKVEEVSSMM